MLHVYNFIWPFYTVEPYTTGYSSTDVIWNLSAITPPLVGLCFRGTSPIHLPSSSHATFVKLKIAELHNCRFYMCNRSRKDLSKRRWFISSYKLQQIRESLVFPHSLNLTQFKALCWDHSVFILGAPHWSVLQSKSYRARILNQMSAMLVIFKARITRVWRVEESTVCILKCFTPKLSCHTESNRILHLLMPIYTKPQKFAH